MEGDDLIASWLRGIEDQSKETLELLANNRIDEAIATWDSLEVSRLANLLLPNLPQRACDANLASLQALASELGHDIVLKAGSHAARATLGPAPPPKANDGMRPHQPNMDMDVLTAAVQAAMQPLMASLEAVERASSRTTADAPQSARTPAPATAPRADPTPRSATTQRMPNVTPAVPHNTPPANQEETWTTVTKRKRKKGGEKQDQADQVLRQISSHHAPTRRRPLPPLLCNILTIRPPRHHRGSCSTSPH